MIVSASRRTDIPAFYAEWFINRVRAGFCCVPNPFNGRVARVSLDPGDVDVLVFWTRDVGPLLRFLPELDERGFRYYFEYSVTGYPRVFEPRSPSLEDSVEMFERLAGLVGRERVVWRYDPLVFTSVTGFEYHLRRFRELCGALSPFCSRVVVSVADEYAGMRRRFARLAECGVLPVERPEERPGFGELFVGLAGLAGEHGLEIVSCAERLGLDRFGIRNGRCVDDGLIERVFGIDVSHAKDRAQRAECGCVVSRDIGAYDSCGHGCVFCYATRSFEAAERNRRGHDPDSPCLLGGVNCGEGPQLGLF